MSLTGEPTIQELIEDILGFSSKENDSHIIAQLGTFTINGIETTRDYSTALISQDYLPKIKLSRLHGLKKTEPLISTWSSGNHIHFAPDQSIPKTFRLNSRLDQDVIIWDDLSRPRYNVIENRQTSIYSFPRYSEAFVKMDTEYLIDYLLKKDKTAIQIFQERRIIPISDKIAALLGDKGHYIGQFNQYEIRLQKHARKNDLIHVEVNGYRVLFDLDKLKEKHLSQKSESGHHWKGIDEFVTGSKARQYFLFQYAYVSDEVLAKYESDDDYAIYPESGSVFYGNKWCVSYCERVGRNAIQVELKKLYEGTPDEVIDYWNSFSIDPEVINKNEINIAVRSERLLRKFLLFGSLLAQIVNKTVNESLLAHQLISHDRDEIERIGLLQHPPFQPITHHISFRSFTKEQFISRCKELHIVLVESIKENSLRRIITEIGFESEKTKSLRTLKLLDLLLKYFYTATTAGLSPLNDKSEILNRIDENREVTIISRLFALNEIRQLDAHGSNKSADKKLKDALQIFEINEGAIANNYAKTSDQVYDALDDMFNNLNSFLIRAFDF
jgi:hypothetical protein